MMCFGCVPKVRYNLKLFSLVLAPTGFPRDVTGTSPSPYSINLSWNPPPLEERSGNIIGYIVNITKAGTLETTQHNTTTTNITITSLEPYTTYICVVAAKTAIGVGPFSHLFFIQTQEGGLCITRSYTVKVLI